MRSLWLLGALSLAACSSTTTEGRVCAPGACDNGQTCVLARCRAEGDVPSPADATRAVIAPDDLAVVAANGPNAPEGELAESVALGRSASGTVAMLLRFTRPFPADAEIASAYVVLSPLAGSPPGAARSTIEVARIVEPWTGTTVTWGRQPRLGVPEITAALPLSPSAPLRVDVTSLVRGWRAADKENQGIALLVSGDDALGVAYSLGAAGGPGPRLEVYFR